MLKALIFLGLLLTLSGERTYYCDQVDGVGWVCVPIHEVTHGK